MNFRAVPNDEGHFDFKEVDVKDFSWRYGKWVGVEGTWNGEAKQFVLRVVLLGVTIGVTGGVTVGASVGANE